jgi:hypothetical protein
MKELFNLVSNEREVDVKEVEKIYNDYTMRCKEVFINQIYRDIYYPQFGTASSAEDRIIKNLRISFQKRDAKSVKKFIKLLRNLRNDSKRL